MGGLEEVRQGQPRLGAVFVNHAQGRGSLFLHGHARSADCRAGK